VRAVIRQREIAQRQSAKGKLPAPETGEIEHRHFWLAGLGFAVLIFFLWAFGGGTRKDSFQSASFGPDKPGTYTCANEFRMNVLCKVSGKVESVESNKVIKFSSGGKKFRLEFKKKMPHIIGTENADVEIVPYRVISSGEIVADVYAFNPK